MRNYLFPMKCTYSFRLNLVGKKEVEKFLKKHPEFPDKSSLFRIAVLEYIYKKK